MVTKFYFLTSLQDYRVWRQNCTYLSALNWCSIRCRCPALTSYSTHSVRVKFFLMERKAILVTDLSTTHAPQNKGTIWWIPIFSPWLPLYTLTTPNYPYIPSLLLSTHYSLLPTSSLMYGDELWWIPKVSYCMMDYGGTLRSNGDQIFLPYESAGLKDLTSKLHIFTGS